MIFTRQDSFSAFHNEDASHWYSPDSSCQVTIISVQNHFLIPSQAKWLFKQLNLEQSLHKAEHCVASSDYHFPMMKTQELLLTFLQIFTLKSVKNLYCRLAPFLNLDTMFMAHSHPRFLELCIDSIRMATRVVVAAVCNRKCVIATSRSREDKKLGRSARIDDLEERNARA